MTRFFIFRLVRPCFLHSCVKAFLHSILIRSKEKSRNCKFSHWSRRFHTLFSHTSVCNLYRNSCRLLLHRCVPAAAAIRSHIWNLRLRYLCYIYLRTSSFTLFVFIIHKSDVVTVCSFCGSALVQSISLSSIIYHHLEGGPKKSRQSQNFAINKKATIVVQSLWN